MVQVKSMEKSTANYLLSAVRGMFNTAQYWMAQGYDADHAIGNAWKYGYGMLRSSVGDTLDWQTAENYFGQLATIANLLADKCAAASKASSNPMSLTSRGAVTAAVLD
jgi:hypothetical protein